MPDPTLREALITEANEIADRHADLHWCWGIDPIMGYGERNFGGSIITERCDAYNAAMSLAALAPDAPEPHTHGDQPCDPSEDAAIEQFERDEGPDPRWRVMHEDAIRFRRDRDYLSGGDMAWRYMQAWRDVDFLLTALPDASEPTYDEMMLREDAPGGGEHA